MTCALYPGGKSVHSCAFDGRRVQVHLVGNALGGEGSSSEFGSFEGCCGNT